MDIKELAGRVVEIIFPLLQIDSINEINKEFQHIPNDVIKKIWKKAGFIFKEGIETEDSLEEAQVVIRSTLRKQFEADTTFKNSMIKLLKELESLQVTKEKDIRTEKNKNVVQESEIEAEGDVQIGDRIDSMLNINIKKIKDSVVTNINKVDNLSITSPIKKINLPHKNQK